MNTLGAVFSEPWVQRLGWVLIHFIWQGAIIGLLLAVALRVLAKATSHVRYACIACALLICAIVPAITWATLGSPTETFLSSVPKSAFILTPEVETSVVTPSDSIATASQSGGNSRWIDFAQALNIASPYVVGLWLCGVLMLTGRLTLGWVWAHRVWSSGLPIRDEECLKKFRALLKRMGVDIQVRLLQSVFVEVPTLIGWLRPAILIPASVFTGLTPDQLEAVLAHELAHVRRYDYLVNLVQTIIETILFYHPAIWWISNKLREERENCCDDIALEVMQDRLIYASALAKLEEAHPRSRVALAMTASGGSLLQRIKRIVGIDDRKVSAWPIWALVVCILLIGCIAKIKPASHLDFSIGGQPVKISDKAQHEITALLEKFLKLSSTGGGPSKIVQWQRLSIVSAEDIKKSGSYLHLSYSKEHPLKRGDSTYEIKDVWVGLADTSLDSYPGHPGGITVIGTNKPNPWNLYFGSKSLLVGVGLNSEIFPHLSVTMQKALTDNRQAYQDFQTWASSKTADTSMEAVAAVDADDIPALQKMVAQGVDLKTIKNDDETLLFNARSPAMVDLLVNQGINVNARNKKNATALNDICLSARKSTPATVRTLLQHGADPNNIEDGWGAPPFYSAMDGATVDALAEYGANLKLRGADDMGPFDMAYGDPSYYDALLRHGVPFDPKTDGTASLVHASFRKNVKLVKWLLDHGVDPNAEGLVSNDKSGPKYDFPLVGAVIDSNEEIATVLIEHGAKGELPMDYALRNKNIKMVKLLWDRGVRNISELCYDVSQDAPLNDLESLLKQGVPADPPQDTIITPMGEAAVKGNLPAVQLLVEHGGDVNKGGVVVPNHPEYVFTPLVLAADEGHDEIVEFLLKHGARPDPRAVEMAAYTGIVGSDAHLPTKEHFERTVQLLIDAGALKSLAPEVRGKILVSSIATCRGEPDSLIVQKLLAAGLSPQDPAKGKDGKIKPVIDVIREYSQQKNTTGTERYAPYIDLLDNTQKDGVKSTTSTHTEADQRSEELFNNLRLENLKVQDMPLDQFVVKIHNELQAQDPQKQGINFVLSIPPGEAPIPVSLDFSKRRGYRANISMILDPLKARYPIRVKNDVATGAVFIQQISKDEVAFKKKAEATLIDVNFSQENPVAALQAVQTASASKGFAFGLDLKTIRGIDAIRKLPTIDLKASQVSVDQVLRSISYLADLHPMPLAHFTGYVIQPQSPEATKELTYLTVGTEPFSFKKETGAKEQILANLQKISVWTGPSSHGKAYSKEGQPFGPMTFSRNAPAPNADLEQNFTVDPKIIDKAHIQVTTTLEIKDANGMSLGKTSGQTILTSGERAFITLPVLAPSQSGKASNPNLGFVGITQTTLVNEDGQPLLPPTQTAIEILPSVTSSDNPAASPEIASNSAQTTKATAPLGNLGSIPATDAVNPDVIHLTFSDSQTQRPITAVKLHIRINDLRTDLITDASGGCDIKVPKEEIRFVAIWAKHEGYVPQALGWEKHLHPIRFPDHYEAHLTPGSPINGKIVDEAGHPLAGSEVTVLLQGPQVDAESLYDHYDLFTVTTKTDAAGKWQFDAFPASLEGLLIRVSHPDFQATTDAGVDNYTTTSGLPLNSLRDGTSIVALKPGELLAGQVFGVDGRPLAGANLALGRDLWGTNLPETKTDAAGHFLFKGIPKGDHPLTVQAAGHKPQVVKVSIPSPSLAIHLAKGRILKGVVVDAFGKPYAGVRISIDSWKPLMPQVVEPYNKLRTLRLDIRTDATGRFAWDGAPDEPVTYYFSDDIKQEYLCDLSLQANDKDQRIVMKPAMHLSAKVVDQKSGLPISHLRMTPGRILPGNGGISWETRFTQAYDKGAVDWQISRLGESYVFKIEADGYQPFVSDPFQCDMTDFQTTFQLVASSR